ncbi:MAG: TIGR00282 family metallophosphoesterase [Candidatus Omnitrophica bacterium]|nr:TIGR00282 family metallophosphoesterase [Candidatus Omnitrophota bacterium]
MRILCIGDIVGRPGRMAIEKLVPALRKELALDCVIANAENAAGGSGITARIAKHMFDCGCDVLTLGDHAWDQKELEDYLKDSQFLLRPLNFSPHAPGRGLCVKDLPSGKKVAVMVFIGRVFMKQHVDCPFRAFSDEIDRVKGETPVVVVDFHAEATSEKISFGYLADGKVSVIFGTHTHVPTADEKILPHGTAYITDVGMTGPHDSVIGQKKENILRKYVTGLPVKFEVAEEDVWLNGIVAEVDENTGKALKIERIRRFYGAKETGD